VRERGPATTAHLLKPIFVRSGVDEVVHVPFHSETACAEDLGKLVPEISVREKDATQAARS
jgi:hypothetical protein